MPNIPGAPNLVPVTTGDCAEQKFLEFATAQNQWNQAFCDLLVALTGDGGNSIQTIREKHSWTGVGSEQVFLDPVVPLTTNCCVVVTGAACLPSIFSNQNNSPNDVQQTFDFQVEIKCDDTAIQTLNDEIELTIPAGGSVEIPKQTIFISQNLEVSQLGKIPDPGVLEICATRNGNPVNAEVTITSLIICQVNLT